MAPSAKFSVHDGARNLFVIIEAKGEIAAVNPTTLAVVAGCSNGMMAIVSMETGGLVTALPPGNRVDGSAFDSGTGSASPRPARGSLTVVHKDGPDRYRAVASVRTQQGARSLVVVPRTDKAYAATAAFGAAPAVNDATFGSCLAESVMTTGVPSLPVATTPVSPVIQGFGSVPR